MNVLADCVLALAALPALLFLWNLTYYLPAKRSLLPLGLPVSILIPARNEERSIEACVRAALATQSVNIEVIVANDHSEDRTAEIVIRLCRGRLARSLDRGARPAHGLVRQTICLSPPVGVRVLQDTLLSGRRCQACSARRSFHGGHAACK